MQIRDPVAVLLFEVGPQDIGEEAVVAVPLSFLVKGHQNAGIKILGDGKLTKKLTVHAAKFSQSARKQIEAAGGTCQEIA